MFAKHCALVLERVIVYSKRESYLEKAKEEKKTKRKKNSFPNSVRETSL